MAQDKARQSTSPESKTHNPQKPARLSLSLACFFALSSIAAAATPTIPTNDPNALVDKLNGGQCPHNNCYNIAWKSGDREGVATGSLAGSWNAGDTNVYGDVSHYYYESIAVAYKNGGFNAKNVMFARGAKVDYFGYNLKRVGAGSSPWSNLRSDNNGQNIDLTIGTFDLKGDVMFEVKTGGVSTIDIVNHQADCLHLKVRDNIDSDKLNVTTLNQLTSANGFSQIFKNVSVEHFNLYAGKSYQRGGKVETLNLLGGEYHLGATDGNTAAEEAGTIGNLVLADGTFKQYKGEIGSITLTGDKKTASFTTKNNFQNDNQGTSYNGLITKIEKQVSGAHTIELGDNKADSTITTTLTNGSLTIDNTTGDIANNGEVSSLAVDKKTGSIAISNATTASIGTLSTNTKSTITNAGTIDKLELKESSKVTNTGIIKNLDVKSGESTINSLNGVGQAAGAKSYELSNIKITANSAKLTVDSLSVGLKGNQAIERVTINGDDTKGQGKEFAVNKIVISHLDDTFDPSKGISTELKDYVTAGSQNYIVGSSKPTFESSPELGGIGIEFGPDGTPHFDLNHSIAASMTSVVVRQSMRRKMLLDTYLAEQSRRSLKNKERRTKQRLEAATLADARAQYQKDLEKYKLDLAKKP